MRRLAVLMPFMIACSEPCDMLAERTCEREGESSRSCFEVRKQVTRANDSDQRFCRETLRILDKLSSTSTKAEER